MLKKIFLAPAALAAFLCCPMALAGEATQVFIDNGELNYFGHLSAEANKKALELLNAQAAAITTLSIRSGGGPTEVGMELGRLVRKHKLRVKVMEFCFSSCANYVFTAAPQKIVSNFAVVGYHGGETSSDFQFDDEQEAKFDALPAEQRAAARQQLIDAIKRGRAPQAEQERLYFQEIGVQQRITTLGELPEYAKSRYAEGNSPGWTYSIDDFAKLGVTNITVVNGPWNPRFVSAALTVQRVRVD
ncbi:peptidase [Massilia sp. BJB1822]|uniref:peptidase n=1 Tax=Massilia sp. BJB1822 TaxID=2744470 RepID=UPI001593EACB|nr:peptidase [Massilia sp. BJB1822]NVE01889.1 peptidase [Massilia sp. BJB1822]